MNNLESYNKYTYNMSQNTIRMNDNLPKVFSEHRVGECCNVAKRLLVGG